jgi:hypothetical protein
MFPRYIPPHIRNRRDLTPLGTASTAPATREPESLSFSPMHVYINTNDNARFTSPPTHDSQHPSQRSHRAYQPTAAMQREIPTAPRAMLRAPRDVHDHSTGHSNQTTGPLGQRRSRSALGVRYSSRESTVPMHSARFRLSGGFNPWHASTSHLHWPGLPQSPSTRQITNLLNARTISTSRWASVTRPGPSRNAPHLVSLTEVATRFGLARDAIHTLNASSYAPDVLKFIVLFENHNRGVERHLVVYAKTNLHLLPGHDLPYPDQVQEQPEDEYDYCSDVYSESDLIDLRSRSVSAASLRVEVSSPSSGVPTPPSSTDSDRALPSPDGGTWTSAFPPIAIFSRLRPDPRSRAFEFLGWYEIEETEFFAPGTSELSQVLGERSGWRTTPSQADMGCEWAKIRLVKHEASESARSDELSSQVDWSRVFPRYS